MASRARRSESMVGTSTEMLRGMCWMMMAMTEGSDGGGGVH